MMNKQDSLAPDRSPNGEHHPGLLSAENVISLVMVRCAGALYGIDMKWVREIQPLVQMTPVYGLPAFWVGLTALRGRLYAVLDLAQVLSPQRTPTAKPQYVVFTAVNQLAVGLLVEEMPTMRRVMAEAITDATSDPIAILDLPGLFAEPRLTIPASPAGGREA